MAERIRVTGKDDGVNNNEAIDAQVDRTNNALHVKSHLYGSDGIGFNNPVNATSDGQLHVVMSSYYDTGNSSETPLVADDTFTGTSYSLENYSGIGLLVYSDVASATGGLMVQFSFDNIVWHDGESYTIPADTTKFFTPPKQGIYYRVIFVNGGTDQTTFHIHALLSKSPFKWSSHNINSNLNDDDDSELVSAVLKLRTAQNNYVSGAATVGGNFKVSLEELESSISENANTSLRVTLVDSNNNILSSSQKLDGTYALDVFNSDVKDNLINLSFINETANTTTIAVAASAGDTQITVVDGSGFAVGDDLTIQDGNELLDNHFKVTAKPSANVITLDMPIDIALTTSAVVTEILDQMNVSGSLASPVTFRIKPPSDETWHITRLLFTMTDQTDMDDAKFGGLTALTNGLVLRKKINGVYTTHANFKYNAKFADSMYDVTYADKAPSGYYGLRGRWTIKASDSIVRLDGANGDELQFLVQDNLTGLDSLHWTAQGHKE